MPRKGLELPDHDPNGIGVYDLLGFPVNNLTASGDLQPLAVWAFSRPFSRIRLDLRKLVVGPGGGTLILRLGSLTSCEEGSEIAWFTATKAFGAKTAGTDEAVAVSAGIPGDFVVLFGRIEVGGAAMTFTPRIVIDRNEGSRYTQLAGGWA